MARYFTSDERFWPRAVYNVGVNLKPARALGWQTLRYDSTARVLEVLDTLAAAKPERRCARGLL